MIQPHSSPVFRKSSPKSSDPVRRGCGERSSASNTRNGSDPLCLPAPTPSRSPSRLPAHPHWVRSIAAAERRARDQSAPWDSLEGRRADSLEGRRARGGEAEMGEAAVHPAAPYLGLGVGLPPVPMIVSLSSSPNPIPGAGNAAGHIDRDAGGIQTCARGGGWQGGRGWVARAGAGGRVDGVGLRTSARTDGPRPPFQLDPPRC